MAISNTPTLASQAATAQIFGKSKIPTTYLEPVGAGLLAIAVCLRRTRCLAQSPPAFLGSSYETELYADFSEAAGQ